MADLILAVLYYLLIFALIGILAAQAELVHDRTAAVRTNRVTVFDRSYGAAAGLLLVVGFMHAFHMMLAENAYAIQLFGKKINSTKLCERQ